VFFLWLCAGLAKARFIPHCTPKVQSLILKCCLAGDWLGAIDFMVQDVPVHTPFSAEKFSKNLAPLALAKCQIYLGV
jgi:hypothetical protein